MEPLSTYFRISPSLLGPAGAHGSPAQPPQPNRAGSTLTPRSEASSSCFSSPSFAEHQTGYKAYLQSPQSLGSPHQVIDNNPLFEGFQPLPTSDGRRRLAGEAGSTGSSGAHTAGTTSARLKQQLNGLLNILQQATILQSTDALHDSVAMPRLAEELEAVVHRLREQEREADRLRLEVQVERRLRAKMQQALGSAEDTIRKLRAAPTPPRTALAASAGDSPWPPGMRLTGSAGSFNPVSSGAGSIVGLRGPTAVSCSGLRDSACKQLLQSPSVSSAGARSPILAVDDASERQMAPPKELPLDRSIDHLLIAHPASSVDLSPPGPIPEVHSPRLLPRAASATTADHGGEPAGGQGGHPPLYGLMRDMLLAATPQPSGVAHAGSTAGAGPAQRCPHTPGQLAAGGNLAVAVRSVLGASASPLMLYGTPLHRRIQRLLAEQRTPLPAQLHPHPHPAATPAGGGEEASASARDTDVLLAHARRLTSTPDSHRWSQTDTPSDSRTATETSSSYSTPRDVASLSALEQRKSALSPFRPLRERYLRASQAEAVSKNGGGATSARGPSELETPAAVEPLPGARPAGEPLDDSRLEAAGIIAELGLTEVAEMGAADHIELLAHVERWAQEQYMAAKRAMLDNAEPSFAADGEEDEEEEELGEEECRGPGDGVTCQPAALWPPHQDMVDMAVQTEPLVQHETAAECIGLMAALRDVGTAISPRPLSDLAATSVASAASSPQHASAGRGWRLADDLDDDDVKDTASPARSDQLKRSPAAARIRAVGAEFEFKPSPSAVAADKSATLWVGTAPANTCSTPARRGLFTNAASTRKPTATADAAACCASPAAPKGGLESSRASASGTVPRIHPTRAARRFFPPTSEIQPVESPAGSFTAAQARLFPIKHMAAPLTDVNQATASGLGNATQQGCHLPSTSYRPHAATSGPASGGPQPPELPMSPSGHRAPAPSDLVPFLKQMEPGFAWGNQTAVHSPAAGSEPLATSRPATTRDDTMQAAPHILMTPGNTARGSRKSLGHMFFLAGRRGSGSSDGHVAIEGGAACQERQLSSISSVSIIRSDVDVDEVPVVLGVSRPAGHKNAPRKVKRPFFEFLVSLSSCSRAPDAF